MLLARIFFWKCFYFLSLLLLCVKFLVLLVKHFNLFTYIHLLNNYHLLVLWKSKMVNEQDENAQPGGQNTGNKSTPIPSVVPENLANYKIVRINISNQPFKLGNSNFSHALRPMMRLWMSKQDFCSNQRHFGIWYLLF